MLEQQQGRLREFLAHERVPPAKPAARVTNDVSDIRGAKPLLKDHVYTNKPHFYDSLDIHGSTSKELHPRTRRVGSDPRYQQGPIEGSSPNPSGFHSKRVCNPLSPDYPLPSFTQAPPVEPRFLRDSYNVSDIDGTWAKRTVVANPRSPLRVDDITGAQAGWRPVHKRGQRALPPRDILNVADITNVDFRSSRVTDVLNPVYTVHGQTTQDDPLMRPMALHPTRNKPKSALVTSDIQGATAADSGRHVVCGIHNAQRRDLRTTNRTDDIPGARADTVLHSIHSQRRVDPTWPLYVALDGQRADASALSVAKSIVFADSIRDHDRVWQRQYDEAMAAAAQAPYVASGIATIGMTASHKPGVPRRATAPAVVSAGAAAMASSSHGGSNSSSSINSSSSSSTRLTPSERKQAASRRDEIQLVRELQ